VTSRSRRGQELGAVGLVPNDRVPQSQALYSAWGIIISAGRTCEGGIIHRLWFERVRTKEIRLRQPLRAITEPSRRPVIAEQSVALTGPNLLMGGRCAWVKVKGEGGD
jgi:hypothetical protein